MAGSHLGSTQVIHTTKGEVEVKVVFDPAIEDLVEHMMKCALGEILHNNVYENLPNNSILNRSVKRTMVVSK